MRRVAWLLLALAVAALAWWGRERAGPPPGPKPVRFAPVPLPADYRDRLVVWDYPWPHPHPAGDPALFDGLPAATWEGSLQEAVAAFRARYPGIDVEVRLLEFGSGPAELAAAAGGPEGPDVAAVWWQGPPPPEAALVPVSPYVDDARRAGMHPLGWTLARRGEQEWVVPGWIAFHAWLADGRRLAPPAGGWDLAAAAAVAGRWAAAQPAFVSVDTAPFLLGELLADAGPLSDAQLEALTAGLRQLRVAARAGAGEPRTVRDLAARRYVLAGGLGPGLLQWVFAHEAARAGAEGRLPLLLPPPGLSAPDDRIPVSLGGYVVLRRPGITAEHAQAAMELAFHLASWQPVERVARMLAVPAARTATLRWEQEAALPALTRRRLLELAEAYTDAPRRYTLPGPLAPAAPDHARWLEAWTAFWRGDDAALPPLLAALAVGAEAEGGP